MANGMILRGEVYWISLDDSAGSEIKTGRPAVVVSGDSANEKEDTVIVAFITSGGIPSPYNVSVVSPEGKKRVLCRQLRTVDKSRLTKFEYKLSAPEMIRVTGALAGSMCIPLRTPESTAQEKENKEITALKAECEMWKRCYDVAMTQLVDLKVSSDLALRMARVGYEYEESDETEEFEEAEVEETPVVEESPKVEEKPEPEPENESVVEQEAPVVEPVVEEPVVVKKVNINTASLREMAECFGTSMFYPNKISVHRKKNGLFVDLEELKLVEGLPKNFYERYAHLCTIGVEEQPPVVEELAPEPVVEPEEQEPKSDKVNINTANMYELMEVGFEKRAAALIVNERKKFGRFRSVDDLSEIPEITGKILRKLRDELEV